MRLDAFGSIRVRSENLGKIGRKITAADYFLIWDVPGPLPAPSPEHLSVGGVGALILRGLGLTNIRW